MPDRRARVSADTNYQAKYKLNMKQGQVEFTGLKMTDDFCFRDASSTQLLLTGELIYKGMILRLAYASSILDMVKFRKRILLTQKAMVKKLE